MCTLLIYNRIGDPHFGVITACREIFQAVSRCLRSRTVWAVAGSVNDACAA